MCVKSDICSISFKKDLLTAVYIFIQKKKGPIFQKCEIRFKADLAIFICNIQRWFREQTVGGLSAHRLILLTLSM